MSWQEILKVDLREARMLGRQHAPEEMSAGKLKVVVEKAIAGGILDMSQSNLYKLRSNQFTSEQLLLVLILLAVSDGGHTSTAQIHTPSDQSIVRYDIGYR